MHDGELFAIRFPVVRHLWPPHFPRGRLVVSPFDRTRGHALVPSALVAIGQLAHVRGDARHRRSLLACAERRDNVRLERRADQVLLVGEEVEELVFPLELVVLKELVVSMDLV